MKNFIIMLFVSLLLAACVAPREAPVESVVTKPSDQSTITAPPAKMAVPTTADLSMAGLTESAKAAIQQGLKDKSVYFDFDTFLVKPQYRDLLRQHVEILKAHPKDTVTLEGNADERGSPEYNLAIGQKRSHAVKIQMTLLGIDGSRIHEVSFGEEKPRVTCHDESCWQQNRRVDFAYRSN